MKNGISGRLAALVSVAALVLGGCRADTSHKPRANTRIDGRILVVRDSAAGGVLRASGTAEPVLRADLSTRLMGSVLVVNVREGDKVRQGQVLLKIDGRELASRSKGVESGIDAARSQLQLADISLRRVRSLRADSAVSQAELDRAEAQYKGARSALESLESQAGELRAVTGYATLLAPFDGRVVSRRVDPGAMASPGVPLLRVEDASRLRIRVNTAVEGATGLKAGQELTGTVGERIVQARIEGVVPSGSGNLVTVNAIVENARGDLPSNGTATLDLPIGGAHLRLVPTEALFREGDLIGVSVRTAKGDHRRWIRTGRDFGGQVEVLSGLREGDTLVIPFVKAGE